jgi:hypothetical protein
MGKAAIVLGGYVASLLAAYAAVHVRNATLDVSPADASGGMYAFGDMLLFLGVFGVCSLVPTVLALWFLRGVPRLWTILSAIAIALAAGAVISACILPLTARTASPPAAVAAISFVALLLMFAAPILAAAFLLSAVVAPTRRTRLMLAGAAAVEVVSVLPYVFWMVARLNGASPLQ